MIPATSRTAPAKGVKRAKPILFQLATVDDAHIGLETGARAMSCATRANVVSDRSTCITRIDLTPFHKWGVFCCQAKRQKITSLKLTNAHHTSP